MTALAVDLDEVTCADCQETAAEATVCQMCRTVSCDCDRTEDCETGLQFCRECVKRCLCRECAGPR